MSDYDLIVRNGMVIDGTGLPRRRVDVGVRDGRVARLAHLEHATADHEIDAEGAIVAPGIVDAHTHYDPQITFDPYATMSCFHGVTTVLAGNCGFSVAPCRPEDREFLTGIFAAVENMDPIALSAITWDEFESFADYLESREGKLGVNLASYVGHSNLRRIVLGDDSTEREASPAEIVEMAAARCGRRSRPARPACPPRPPRRTSTPPAARCRRVWRRTSEVLALADVLGEMGRGSIGFLPASAVGGLDHADEDYLIEIGRRAGLPVIIQGLGGRNKVDAPTATWEASQAFLDRATRARRAGVLDADRPAVRSEGDDRSRQLPLPGGAVAGTTWSTSRPTSGRALLRDPGARDELRHAVENYNRDPAKGTTVPPPLWKVVFVHEVARPENERWQARSIADMAAELGVEPADAMLDLALAEDFRTEFRWRTETPEWTDAVGTAQLDPRMIVGTSDGGAHLARDDGADWSSYFLRSWVLDRKVWSLEEGIRQITQVPAALLGFADRGTVQVGKHADLMIFDPDTIGPWKKEFVNDLPGGVGRYKAWGKGVRATIVNGVPIVVDGELTGALPGQVVRPS